VRGKKMNKIYTKDLRVKCVERRASLISEGQQGTVSNMLNWRVGLQLAKSRVKGKGGKIPVSKIYPNQATLSRSVKGISLREGNNEEKGHTC